jgi:hypothetical protein
MNVLVGSGRITADTEVLVGQPSSLAPGIAGLFPMNLPGKYVPLCHLHITIRFAIRYQVNPQVAGQSHGRWALAEQIRDQSWYEHKTVVAGFLWLAFRGDSSPAPRGER